MTDPLVSVVVPTYDRLTMVRRAVRSVAAQTYSPVELIVVDDGSSTPIDGSELDVSAFSACRLRRHDHTRGGNAARATGIEAARGEYVAFLDDDDTWAPEKLERQVAAFDRVPADVGLVYTGVRQVDADGRTNAVRTPRIGGDVTERLLYWNFVGTFSAVMIRHAVIERIGLPDDRFPSWQDWEFYLRISRTYRFGAVPEPLVVRHNRTDDQISRDYTRKRDVTVPLFESTFEPLAMEYGSGCWRRVRARLRYQLGRSALRAERYDEARRQFLRAVRISPTEFAVYPYLLASLGGARTYEPLQQAKRRLVRWRDG
ncbi:glycosyltransferase [Halalkalicoccus subterraneus]|uniref:glycosyltransferase n=1 Tax=Halalkalicoccus subterraneus TaxID=2675002 RepID=UPI001FE569B1|nr:glycosyltransferase [Halalkalicoccus subterraneus]